MDRRTFAQSLGGAAMLSRFPATSGWAQASATARPGRVMAIAAHPGDALFTMGATVAQQIARGGSGVFVSLSQGEKGAPKHIPVTQYGAMQRAATDKATQLLGATAVILDYRDAEIPYDEQSALRVCDVIREHKPDVVITHWSGSWHRDHRACHEIVRDALFYADLGTLARARPPHTVSKTYYAENWEDATNFAPDTYVDIEQVFEKWMQACDFYPMWRGQTGFFRYNDYYGSLAVMRGCLSHFKHAVALMSDENQRTRRAQSL